MSLNRAMIIGNLGEDPEIRYTPTGLPVVKFVGGDGRGLPRHGGQAPRTSKMASDRGSSGSSR